ncbi:MAG: hypothetical protein H8D23_13145 [Candidatus Brocadiales bacterium]|nr:hypothetical protein [Candidatus Brocadiales bacterium]
MPPWEVGRLSLGFEDIQIQEILSNHYTGWDSIPEQFRPDSVRVTSENWGTVRAYVSNRQHPVLLAEQYQGLPGLKWAEASTYGVFDYPHFPILVFDHDGQLEYVFHLYEFESHHFKIFEYEPVYLGEMQFIDWTHTDTNYVDLAYEFMDWGQP